MRSKWDLASAHVLAPPLPCGTNPTALRQAVNKVERAERREGKGEARGTVLLQRIRSWTREVPRDTC